MNAHELKTTPWDVRAEDFRRQVGTHHKMQFLLRYAILAPSTRNTQPWRFKIDGERMRLYGDELLWQRVADPHARELHISLGCAVENLLVAAEHFGYRHHVEYFPGSPGDVACQITLEPSARAQREPEASRVASGAVSPRVAGGGALAPVALAKGAPTTEGKDVWPREVKEESDELGLEARDSALFAAITKRHTNHRPYDGRAIPKEHLEALERSVREEGLSLLLTADPDVKRTVDGLVVEGDAIQFARPEFREELGQLIGRGTFGTPWLFSHIGQLAMSYLDLGKRLARKDHELLMSAPVLGILGAPGDDRETHLKVGRAFERVFLTATALGLAVQPVSQIVEVPDLRVELAKSVPLRAGCLPQQPFRLGYGEPEKEHTPRRPLEEVLM